MAECKVYFKDANSMREVENNSVQLIVTTPPDIARSIIEYKTHGYNLYSLLTPGKYLGFRFYADMFSECYRVLKYDGVFFFNMGVSQKDYMKTFNGNTVNCLFPYVWVANILHLTPFLIKEDFIWVKTSAPENYLPSRKFLDETRVVNVYEHFFMFTKTTKWKFNPPKSEGNMLISAWFADSVLPEGKGDLKCTPFNEKILRNLIKAFSDEGDTVLDPMAGTGTLGKVAVELGRNAVLYEIREELKPTIKEKVGGAFVEGLVH